MMEVSNPQERPHALLGASSAKRWMHCTNSVRFTENLPNKSSEYADEGTAAHTLGEIYIRIWLGGNDGADIAEAQDFMKDNKYFCSEMNEAAKYYSDLVEEHYNEALATTKDAKLFVEQRVDFSEWVPDGFGTSDVVIIADGTMEIIDYKHGKGVPVYAPENPQMRLYALGAYREFELLYDIQEVRMTIVQPRLDNVSTDCMTIEDLLHWADTEVKHKAEESYRGTGIYEPSDEACQFCPGGMVCRARAEAHMSLESMLDVDENTLSPADLADLFQRIEPLVKWANKLKDYVLGEAERGVKIPGFKLVEGRSNRVIVDKEKAAEELQNDGYKEDQIYKPREFKGITDLEKLVGKKRLDTLLGDLIVKPAGKPTLAAENDPRPEIQSMASAKADFGDNYTED